MELALISFLVGLFSFVVGAFVGYKFGLRKLETIMNNCYAYGFTKALMTTEAAPKTGVVQ